MNDYMKDELQRLYGRVEREYKFPNTFDKNRPLHTSPHYTDDRFKKEQTVFGEEQSGLAYDYSDRLWQWDSDKAKEALEVAKNSGEVKSSAAYYEVYLSHYFGKPVEIGHIIAGVGRSNGYPYCVFGYRDALDS